MWNEVRLGRRPLAKTRALRSTPCQKYACACKIRTATKPAQPIEKSVASASVLAQVIVGKVADHLPVYRQAKIFRRLASICPIRPCAVGCGKAPSYWSRYISD